MRIHTCEEAVQFPVPDLGGGLQLRGRDLSRVTQRQVVGLGWTPALCSAVICVDVSKVPMY